MMMRAYNPAKWMAFFTTLLVMFVVVSPCLAVSELHACCSPSSPLTMGATTPHHHDGDTAQMACCQLDMASSVLLTNASEPFLPEMLLAVPVARTLVLLSPEPTDLYSLRHTAWIPDQSERYLELRVLLN